MSQVDRRLSALEAALSAGQQAASMVVIYDPATGLALTSVPAGESVQIWLPAKNSGEVQYERDTAAPARP